MTGCQRCETGRGVHTVRRAYAELEAKGVVRTEPQRGTVVLGRDAAAPVVDPVDWFVSRIVTEAYERHGLTLTELKVRLDRWERRPGGKGEHGVYVVERGESTAAALAAELRARWDIGAEGWSLERPTAPPEGLLVGTLPQYAEIRTRWPERLADAFFVGTRPDASLATRVVSTAPRAVRAVLCERDAATARGYVADVRRVLPTSRVEVIAHVVSRPGELLAFVPESVDAVLFPPRMWEGLTAVERAHPKAVEVRYTFEPKELDRLASDLGWVKR